MVWEEATLSRWLTDPDKFIPGQKMFVSVPDAKERADIVAYLLQAARPQPSTPANLENEMTNRRELMKLAALGGGAVYLSGLAGTLPAPRAGRGAGL